MRALLLAALMLSGCANEHDIQQRTGRDTWYQTPTDQVDILFVIDDSHSMAEEQQALADGFSAFIQEIEATDTDFHLGIITTSFDYTDPDRGKLIGTPTVITSADDYAALFTQRVQVGVTGSDREKGLEAAAWALSPAMLSGVNSGFLRSEAYLLVVFVSDENDCSDRGALEAFDVNACYDRYDDLVPVEVFVDELVDTKGGKPEKVVLSAIVGPERDMGCTDAVPGFRYMDAAHLTSGLVGDICQQDWSGILWELGLNATGIYYSFRLSYPAVEDSLEVYVDGEDVPADATNGWTYDAASWYVTFHGTSVPPRGSTIHAEYTIGSGY